MRIKTMLRFLGTMIIIGSILFPFFPLSRAQAGSNATYIFGAYTVEAFTTVGSTTWTPPAGVTSIDILVVAGGGKGAGTDTTGGGRGCGGGAGGLAYKAGATVVGGMSYSVVIGAGASGYGSYTSPAPSGSNSVAFGITAFGGGGGGVEYNSQSGIAGGSGGGSPSYCPHYPHICTGGASTQTSNGGAIGYGFAGGVGDASGYLPGGGGAGGTAPIATSLYNGYGGIGRDYSSIFGTTYGESGRFAGGGATYYTGAPALGYGGGYSGRPNALANSGGGGWSPIYYNSSSQGNGGSGIVLIRYLTVVSPTVSTQNVTEVLAFSVTGNGNIIDTGGSSPTRRGFCYMIGSSGDPTTENLTVYMDNTSFGTGSFSQSIPGLSSNTSYRVRAYAVNSIGTSYGSTVSATTLTGIPLLTSQATTNMEMLSVTGNGTITDLSGGVVTRRGFCYMIGTSGDPTTTNSVVYTDNTSFGTGSFSQSITGLSAGTSYRVRPYATTTQGTGYGVSATVSTLTGIPSLTTQVATGVTVSSLTANGTLASLNGAVSATSLGFCYFLGSSGDPTISDSIVHQEGTYSPGTYSLSIPNLTVGTSYRVRAYGTTTQGTGYGTSVTMSTLTSSPSMTTELPTNIASTSLTANGNIVSLGGVSATRRGFCYVAGGGEPTLSDNLVYEDGTFGVGTYSLPIVNLIPGTIYRIKAYSTTTYGTYYGEATSTGIPILTTGSAGSITPSSFLMNGNITSLSGSPSSVTRRGFCYLMGTSGDPTTVNSVRYEEGSYGTGIYSLSISSLSMGTSYRVRSYALTIYGIGYGDTVTVTTGTIGAPTMTTGSATSLDYTSFTMSGSVVSINGANLIRRGFCYKTGTTGDPTISDSVKYENGNYGAGSFSLSLTGLSVGTSYRVRAYGTTTNGTGYGSSVTVLTNGSIVPSMVTNSCSGLTESSATMNGSIMNLNGVSSISRRGFCYMEGATGTPTVSDNIVYSDGSYGVGDFSFPLSMSPGTFYRVRAYGVSSAGVGYGDTVSTGAPELAAPIVETVTNSSVSMSGRISYSGSGHSTRRGFVYSSSSSYPSVENSEVVYEDGDFDVGDFLLSLPLVSGITYTVRPYAVTAYGVGYGGSVTVMTLSGSDYEGEGGSSTGYDVIVITAIPSWISISITPDSWIVNRMTGEDFVNNAIPALRSGDGLIRRNATYYSNPAGGSVVEPSSVVTMGECYFTITNESNVPADVYVNFPDFFIDSTPVMTNGNGTPGIASFSAWGYREGGSNLGILAPSDNTTEKLNSEAIPTDNGTLNFGLKITTQTGPWTVPGTMTSTVSVSAFENGEIAVYE